MAAWVGAVGIGSVVLPATAAAHHAGGQEATFPWALLSLLVLVLAYAAVRVAGRFMERREKRPSSELDQQP